MSRMRALSVRQPWAWAICVGLKRVENRTWTTDYRGPVAIHAAAADSGLRDFRRMLTGEVLNLPDLALGSVVGVADLVEVMPLREAIEHDPDAEGPFCWVFERPQVLAAPVPVKGRVSLFYLTEDASRLVEEQTSATNVPASAYDPRIAAAVHPDRYDLQLSRAENYWNAEQDDAAFRCCARAITLQPESSAAYRMRGHMRLVKRMFDESLEDLNRAISLDAEDAVSCWLRGKAYEVMGDTQSARADFAKSKEIDPETPAALEEAFAFDDPNDSPSN
jgi:hypothetical protein